jgi:hypothetical protein
MTRRPWLLRLIALLAATFAAAVLGSVAQTQASLAALEALGADVPLGLRATTTLDDLVGFAPTYGALLLPGFLVAFAVAARLARRWPRRRATLFALAGAVAVATALVSMRFALGLQPVAAARDAVGLSALALAGAIGGAAYARMTRVMLERAGGR